jgi:hypothetical protein
MNLTSTQLHHSHRTDCAQPDTKLDVLRDSASPMTSDGGVTLHPSSNFGLYCTVEKHNRIDMWLGNLSPTSELINAATAPTMTVELYKDWLHWQEHTAITWLRQLDRLERYFRRAALDYHKIPYQLRHSPTMKNRAKIAPVTLKQLSEILETDRPRSRQSYFITWYEIRDAAVNVLEDLRYYRPLANDVDSLRILDRKFDQVFGRLEKPFRNAKVALRWLVEKVEYVSARAKLDASEALASSYSREGSLFRRWISTLPEADRNLGRTKLAYIEWYAHTVLDEGLEKEAYWSMLENLNGFRSAPATPNGEA